MCTHLQNASDVTVLHRLDHTEIPIIVSTVIVTGKRNMLHLKSNAHELIQFVIKILSSEILVLKNIMGKVRFSVYDQYCKSMS